MPPSNRSKGKSKSKSKTKGRKPAASNQPKFAAVEASSSPGLNNSDEGRERNGTQKTSGEATAEFTLEHSFEQMRIVALALTSRIAFDRNLFPGINYQLRRYDPADPDPSYKSFVDGTSTLLLTEHVKNWKVLPHGVQKGADQLLGWLEEGISDAIEHGYLKKFEFTIHSKDDGKICHSNMLESYAMSFTYGPEPEIEFCSTNGTSETLVVAKTKVYELVENFSKTYRARMATAKPLPRFVRLGMMMLYNDTCPSKYVAPSFRAGDHETLKILKTAQGDSGLSLDTGFHELSLGWSIHSQLSNNSFRNTTVTGNPLEGVDSPAENARQSGGTQISQPARRLSSLLKRKTRSVSRQSSILRETQNENIERMQGWQLHRSKDDLTYDTQPLSSPWLRVAGRPIKGLLSYTPEINERIWKARAEIEAQEDGEERLPVVFCGCDSISQTGGLIECEICATFQHYSCYGYKFLGPKTHVCYRCLDSSTHGSSQHPEEMVILCITRRALYYLEELGHSSKTLSIEKLSDHLACSYNSTDLVLNSLVEKQLIKLNHKTRAGEVEFSLDGVNYLKYFHPEMCMEDHLFNYGDDDEPASRVQSVHSTNRTRSIRSLHGPPSLADDDSPGYNEASHMHSSGRDDSSSTAGEEFHSSPEDDPAAVSSMGRQTRSGFQTFSPAKPLKRKQKSKAAYAGQPSIKKARAE